MWPLKSIDQIGAGPCDKLFERLTVLRVCSRTIFHSTCTGDGATFSFFLGWSVTMRGSKPGY